MLCWLVSCHWCGAALALEPSSSQISDTVKILSQGYLWCALLWQHILEPVSQCDIGHHFGVNSSHQVLHMTAAFCLEYLKLAHCVSWFYTSWIFLIVFVNGTAQTVTNKQQSTTFMFFHNESLFVSLQKWWKILILTHHISGLPSLLFQDRWDWAWLVYLVCWWGVQYLREAAAHLNEVSFLLPDRERHVPEQGERATREERFLSSPLCIALPDSTSYHPHLWGKDRWRRAI